MVKTIISMSLWQISVRSQALNKYFFSTDGLRFTWLGKPHNYLSLWPTAKGLGPNLRISSIPCLSGQINYFSLNGFCVRNFCCNFKIQAIKHQSVPQGRQTSGEHPQYRGLRIVLGHHNFSPSETVCKSWGGDLWDLSWKELWGAFSPTFSHSVCPHLKPSEKGLATSTLHWRDWVA